MPCKCDALRKRVERLTDLVRYQRQELFSAGLISDKEYADLVQVEGAVARLETYDEVRAKMAGLQQSLEWAQAEKHSAQADAEREKSVADGLRLRVEELEDASVLDSDALACITAERNLLRADLAAREREVEELRAQVEGLREALFSPLQPELETFRDDDGESVRTRQRCKCCGQTQYGTGGQHSEKCEIVRRLWLAREILSKPPEPSVEIPLCPPHEGLLRAGKLEPLGNCVACIRNERDQLRRALQVLWSKTGDPVYLDNMKVTHPRGAYVCPWCDQEGYPEVRHADDCPVRLVRATISATPAQHQPHPEDHCQRCGGPNITWFAPNELRNRVVGSGNGILCPVCFVKAAERAGVSEVWSVVPENAPTQHASQAFQRGMERAAIICDVCPECQAAIRAEAARVAEGKEQGNE